MSEDKPPPIDIRPDHWAIVRDILKRHVPECDVWAFGSRAGWTAKPYSDLDLAVSCAAPLSLEKLGELRDAFSESDLPWKVDVVDLATVDAAFRKIIDAGKVEVQVRENKVSGTSILFGEFVELKRGYDLPTSERNHGQVPIISSSGLTGWHNKAMVKGPGVVTGRYGTIGEVFYMPGSFWPLNTTLYVRDFKGNNPRFIYYFLKTLDWSRFNDKSSVPGINRNHVHATVVRVVTDEHEQRAIASILSALDDKIELNRRMNETLEQMTLAIFRDWFVDFGPVRRKQEGARDPIAIMGGLVQDATRAAELAALFPDAFGDDSFPEGWSPIRLGDYIEVKRGGSPRPIQDFIARSGLPWLKISDATAAESPYLFQTKEFIREEGLKKTVQLKEGSLILSNSATPGLPKFVMLDACIHDGWLYFPNKKFFSDQYLYLYFLHLRDSLVSQGNGSIFTNLKTEIVRSQQMLIPSVEIIFSFQEIIAPVFEMILAASKENRTLIKARDYLLPKLMSGEVSVRETESIAEAAL